MSATDIRQYLVAMTEAVLKGFAHSNDHKQLVWDLKALEPLRPGHASNKSDKMLRASHERTDSPTRSLCRSHQQHGPYNLGSANKEGSDIFLLPVEN